jgi:hypothetical protein
LGPFSKPDVRARVHALLARGAGPAALPEEARALAAAEPSPAHQWATAGPGEAGAASPAGIVA